MRPAEAVTHRDFFPCLPLKEEREFPGSPVDRTLCIHSRRHGFDRWLGSEDPPGMVGLGAGYLLGNRLGPVGGCSHSSCQLTLSLVSRHSTMSLMIVGCGCHYGWLTAQAVGAKQGRETLHSLLLKDSN